jgi:hypothetical protein
MSVNRILTGKQYLLICALLLGLAAVPFAMSYLFLRHQMEMAAADQIAAAQLPSNGLYGTAANDNTYQYKLALYRDVRPAIVAVGSSRVLQIRGDGFRQPFVNLGLTVRNISEGSDLLKDITAIHKPEVIILGLDFWWFNAKYSQPQTYPSHLVRGDEVSYPKLAVPFEAIRNKKIDTRYFWQVATHGEPEAQRLMGLNAIVNRTGYARDGSEYSVSIMSGRQAHHDYQFGTTQESLRRHDNKYVFGDAVDPARYRALQDFLAAAHQNGIKVIVFLPPVANATDQKVMAASKQYAYIDELRQKLRREPGVLFFDFHAAASIGTNDCEFVDGDHAGDVAYARLLLKMMENPASGLERYVDPAVLREKIKRYAGLAMTPNRFQPNGHQEIDFLGIGCKKPIVAASAAS